MFEQHFALRGRVGVGGNRFDGLKHLHQYFDICATVLPDQVKGNVDQPQKTDLGGQGSHNWFRER
jgi:hypothetical protein